MSKRRKREDKAYRMEEMAVHIVQGRTRNKTEQGYQ